MKKGINKSNYEAYFLDYLEGRLSAPDAEDLFAFLLAHPTLADELEDMRAGFEVVSNVSNLDLHSESLDEQAKLSLRKTLNESGLSENDLLLVKEREGHITQDELSLLDALCAANEQLKRDRSAMLKNRMIPVETAFEEKAKILWPDAVDMSDTEMLLAAATEGDLSASELRTLASQFSSTEAFQSALKRMKQAVLTPAPVVFEHKDSLRKKETVVIPFRRYFAYTAAAAAMAVIIYTLWPQQTTNARMAASWENEQLESKLSAATSSDVTNDTINSVEETTQHAPFVIHRVNETGPVATNRISTTEHDSLHLNPTTPNITIAPQEIQFANQEENNKQENISAEINLEELTLDEHPVSYEADKQKFFTVREIVETKLKSWAWGNKNYPDKAFGSSLLLREIAKYNARSTKKRTSPSKGLQFENIKSQDHHTWRLRIGKLEYSKRSKK
jgi:hypothetical protein